jgi:two-component system sensor histidine kinase/response regulator
MPLMTKILVVDDDPSVLRSYGRLLRRSGYEAVTDDGGPGLMDRLAGHRDSDLLILDYRMPTQDGLTVLEGLRARGPMPKTILISAYANEEVRRRARALGVETILEKPVDVSRLRRTIQEALESVQVGDRDE